MADPTLSYESVSLEDLRAAASGDDPESWFRLANALHEADNGEGVEWYNRAADRGHPGANYQLSLLYREVDAEMADYYLNIAKELGWEAPPDAPLDALAHYREAAEGGDAEAMCALGRCYLEGEGVDTSSDAAEEWFERAAALGSADGLFFLGCLRWARADRVDARRLFRQAASKGHARAQEELAAMDAEDQPRDADAQFKRGWFFSDHEDDQDLELALFWFGRAARQGHAEAMFLLARMIEGDEGPVRDRAQATLWYRRAAAAGFAPAQQVMASRPPEAAPAQGQLEMAIAGDGRSQYQMGFAHLMGNGAPKDYIQSYFWFQVLSQTMPAQASQMLQMLAGRLDAGTREQLDAIARAWSPGNPPPESTELIRLRAAATLDDGPACYALGKALDAIGATDAKAEALEWFVWGANEGHVPSHYALAFHYHEVGDELESERHLAKAAGPPASLELLAEGAARGINQCRYELAGRLATEPGVERDPPRTLALYRAAADEGYAPALAKVGACYYNGYGVERDLDQAERWFAEGAKREDGEALYGLGAVHRLRGQAEEAGRFFERAAGRGHSHAQYLLGNFYAEGAAPFEQDYEKAVYWYEQSARQNHPTATFRLAAHLLYGRGVEQDFDRGWQLTEKAAQMGDVDAMVALAAMIDSGDGPVDDPEVALGWYRRAAGAGNAEAQYRTAKRLIDTCDETEARPFLEQAAAQGHEDAQTLLERIRAEEAERDAAAQRARSRQGTVEWSNNPDAMAIAGDTNAQFQLGFAHYSGIGVPQSFRLSYFWLKVVERSMPMAVKQMLDVMGAQLGDAQRAELDQLAAAWTPGTSPPALS